MSREQPPEPRLPKGVTLLPRARGGRRFLARIRPGRGAGEVHLGIYATAGEAALAFNVASQAIGRGSRPPNEVAKGEQPDAEQVRRITAKVRRRLGLDRDGGRSEEVPPDPDDLLTLFEVTVVGFWRGQAAQGASGSDVDSAGRRLAEAARLVFWSPPSGHPDPREAMARLLARRLDQAFRRGDLARAILDDDGDDDWRVARWLALPDAFPPARGFRDEVRFLYPDLFVAGGEAESEGVSLHWARVLGVDPPYSTDKVRDAYRARSKLAHPDLGGSHADFIRLQAAHDEAREYCRIMGV